MNRHSAFEPFAGDGCSACATLARRNL